MAQINLLPWRQAERDERKQSFLILLGVAALITSIGLGISYFTFGHFIKEQNRRNAFLQGRIRIADQKTLEIENIKRNRLRLAAQIKVIQNLQAERPKVVKVLDVIPRIVTSGMFLNKVTRRRNTVDMWGFAESNPAVADMMRNIERTGVLTDALDEYIRLKPRSDSALDKEFHIIAKIK